MNKMRVRRILLSFMGLFDFNRGEEPEDGERWRGVGIIAPLGNHGSGKPEVHELFFLFSFFFSTGAGSDKAAHPTFIFSE